MTDVVEWLVQNRDKIEKGVEIMAQASSVLASTVGQLHPVLEAVFQASAILLKDPNSGEASYLTQQLTKVNDQLSVIQNEIGQIELEMMTASMNKQNFDWEVHILSQFEKFQDFVKAKQEYKAKKKEKFITHYEITGRDLNVEALYNAVMEESATQKSILETVLVTQEKSRRPVEDFCARLKKLFVVGIISIMAHSAFKEETVDAEIVKKWKGRMEKVEDKMKAAVDDCIENFAEQAKVDLSKKLDENTGPIDPDFTKSLLETLTKKYDWVSWSIRAFKHRERIFFFNWLAGKKYHGSKGNNWFDFLTKNKVKVVVSFCTEPKPIDKSRIQELIEQTKLNRNMMSVALALHDAFPDYLIHAVSHYKTVQEANNFPVECLYFTRYKGAYLCFHSQ
ncbi:SE-cephalotoxin isoform X1 [Nematolebias whitei]|uniref:SE-cephalotoxin isoform X1 n=1 Tax=Nematolebias whitei TaxID=451745 RepID=UPI0018973B1F|nr:SE-cephalotoxin isoform X1 [Nematolebias whitei]